MTPFIGFYREKRAILMLTCLDWAAANWHWVAAALIGFVVGGIELVSQYRDAPGRALRNLPAFYYMTINAFASIVCLLVLKPFISLPTSLIVLIAGLAGMALLRTDYIIHVAGQDKAVKLSEVFQGAKQAADREVGRLRGVSRNNVIGRVMNGVSFDKAKEILPSYCIRLVPNLTEQEITDFADGVAKIQATNASDQFKANELGIGLLDLVGERVLTAAVRQLGEEIKA